jgi:hypothetical protein
LCISRAELHIAQNLRGAVDIPRGTTRVLWCPFRAADQIMREVERGASIENAAGRFRHRADRAPAGAMAGEIAAVQSGAAALSMRLTISPTAPFVVAAVCETSREQPALIARFIPDAIDSGCVTRPRHAICDGAPLANV